MDAGGDDGATSADQTNAKAWNDSMAAALFFRPEHVRNEMYNLNHVSTSS